MKRKIKEYFIGFDKHWYTRWIDEEGTEVIGHVDCPICA